METPHSSRLRRVLIGVCVVFAATAFALVVAEFVFRLVSDDYGALVPQYLIIDTEGELFEKSDDPGLLYEMTPHAATGRLYETELEEPIEAWQTVRINSLGFYDHDYPIPKPPDRFRVVGLGDSIAFGLGIPPEQSFQKRIEAIYRDRGDPVDVVNCAVPGYNMIQIEANYRLKASAYQPDRVLLSYFVDDFFQPKIPKRAAFWRQLAQVHSRLYMFLRWRVLAGGSGRPAQFYADKAAVAEGKRAMRLLAEELAGRGVGLYVVIHPTLESEFDERPHFVEFVREALAGTGVPILNLFPLYLESGAPIESYRNDPADFTHPNARGHELIAEWIVRDWDRRGLRVRPGSETVR